MTVTINTPVQTGSNTWLVSWSSNLSTPTYYIYQDGTLIKTMQTTSTTFWAAAGESLNIEILDDEDEVPESAFPGRLTLAWEKCTETDYYRIDEYVDAAWTERARIPDDGTYYYQWQTRFLEDVTSHQFRIVPVGDNGNEGAAKTFTVLMVRHPAEPSVSYTYAALTGVVTIASA